MISIKNAQGEDIEPEKYWELIHDGRQITVNLLDADVSHPEAYADIKIVRKGRDFSFKVPTHDQLRLYTECYLLIKRTQSFFG